jgi:glycosyltransferase involved in cell wall biosynthesis
VFSDTDATMLRAMSSAGPHHDPRGVTRRRLLMVSHVFPPLVAGGAPRMGQFARLLPDHGWDVTVLTGQAPASVAIDTRGAAEIEARARVIATRSPASQVVRRGAAVPKRGVLAALRNVARTITVGLVFPDRDVFWVPGAIRAGRQALASEPHDAVLATYGPGSNLLVGRALAAQFKLPLIVDFRDLWSTIPLDVFASRVHRAAAFKLEHSIVRKASRILAVAPHMARDLAIAHGIDESRSISITNGFDPTDHARVHDARAGTGPFRLVYTGTVHVHYDLAPLFTAVRRLADAGEITPESFRLEFVGNLAGGEIERHGLAAYVDRGPFVARAELFAALARADALLVVETPGYYARYGYAAKVFDYVLTGKPVVAVVESGGNTDTLLRGMGVGHCATPGDVESITRAIRSVLACKDAPPRTVAPDASPLADFNRRNLVAKLATVLDDVASTEPQGRWT